MIKKKTKEKKSLKNYALKLLSYRPRSKAELKFRLSRFARKKEIKNFKSSVDKVVRGLEKNGKIRDLDFAKWWINQRIEFKPRGKRLLRAELRQKGVDDKLIEKAIKICWQEEKDIFGVVKEAVDDTKLAKRAAQKQSKKYKKEGEKVYQQKMVRYLIRKGFNYNTAIKAAKEVRNK